MLLRSADPNERTDEDDGTSEKVGVKFVPVVESPSIYVCVDGGNSLETEMRGMSVLGHGLNRPESVLTHSSGLLFCSDWWGNGGVATITPRGDVHRVQIADGSLGLRPR